MRIENLHRWNVNVEQAIEIQQSLASKINIENKIVQLRLVAGVDVSVNKSGEAEAAAVVLNYPELKVLEISKARGKTDFPYIPGLLSFREIPLTLQACERLNLSPDLVIVDGQGIAHPRRIGLASHLGLFLNVPTIGCAKSPLYGNFQMPGDVPGDFTNITDKDGKIIGAVLRTKSGVKPLYISIGHKINLSDSIKYILLCCRGYRLPEPTRQAHLASKGNMIEYLKN
jgi:deoxyribonuclease V